MSGLFERSMVTGIIFFAECGAAIYFDFMPKSWTAIGIYALIAAFIGNWSIYKDELKKNWGPLFESLKTLNIFKKDK